MLNTVRSWDTSRLKGDLYCGDASELLRSLEAESVDLFFLDPPFNLGKKYSAASPHMDRRPEQDYGNWLTSILTSAATALRPGGSLFLYHLPQWAVRAGAELDKELAFRHWIAVSMKNGFVRGNRLYPAHYALLYFTKGAPSSFSRPRLLPQRCRHCNNLIKDYGGYRSIIEEKGINLSDVWEDVSPVRHASTKHRAANELPSIIPERVLSIAGRPGGLFVDPFAGAGGSVIEASKAGMRFLAADAVPENCALIASRLDQYSTTDSETTA